MRARRDFLLALLFVAAAALPGLALFETAHRSMTVFENRRAEPWPALALLARDHGKFLSSFDQAFADRFGGRDTLARLHHTLSVAVFGVSPVKRVLIGKNGWLFFLGEQATQFDRHYRGVPPYSDDEIAAVAAELERRHAFLAARGIGYVVAVVPDKYTVYPEQLPGWAVRATRTPLDRVAELLSQRKLVNFVDLRAVLRSAKVHDKVFFKTDSHWTIAGAIAGHGGILREAARVLSKLDRGVSIRAAPSPASPYDPGEARFSGDLARMIGLPERFRETFYAPLWMALARSEGRCARRLEPDIYACADPRLPRAVVYRDSMGLALVPLLAEDFSRTVFVVSRMLDPALIARERPDLVIEQMVERSLFQLVASPMPAVR